MARLRLSTSLLLASALLVAPIVGLLVWDRVARSGLDARLDAIEQRGEPMSAGEAGPRPNSDEQKRAARLYAGAMRLTANVPIGELSAATVALDALDRAPLSEPPDPAALDAVCAVEPRFAEPLALIDRAAAMDARGLAEEDRGRPLNFALARINAIRVACRTFRGDGDGAARALIASLRISRVVPLESSRFYPLRTFAGLQRLLSRTKPAAGLLDALEQEYHRRASIDSSAAYLEAQRASFLEYAVFSAPAPRSPIEAMVTRMTRPYRATLATRELKYYEEAIDVARQPLPARLDAAKAMERKYLRPRSVSGQRPNFWTRLTMALSQREAASQVTIAVAGEAETSALARCSEAALAVERYARDHAGALPRSLEQLVPATLASVPIDPFASAPLRYAPSPDGFKIYSVGANRIDEGGTWGTMSDIRASRAGDPKDLGLEIRRR
jgi:hypothetical protein